MKKLFRFKSQGSVYNSVTMAYEVESERELMNIIRAKLQKSYHDDFKFTKITFVYFMYDDRIHWDEWKVYATINGEEYKIGYSNFGEF